MKNRLVLSTILVTHRNYFRVRCKFTHALTSYTHRLIVLSDKHGDPSLQTIGLPGHRCTNSLDTQNVGKCTPGYPSTLSQAMPAKASQPSPRVFVRSMITWPSLDHFLALSLLRCSLFDILVKFAVHIESARIN